MSTITANVSAHGERVEFLRSLAVLSGCITPMSTLPDGRRPDVVGISSADKMIFLGEAKETESPGNTATRARLAGYFKWMKVVVGGGNTAVLAICFGNATHINGWLETVEILSNEFEMPTGKRKVRRFGGGLIVVSAIYRFDARPTLH